MSALSNWMGDGIVWDNHACMPFDVDCAQLPGLLRWRASGVDVVSLNVASGDQLSTDALKTLTTFRNWLLAHSPDYMLVNSVAEVQRAKKTGKLGVCFDIEGMTVLDGNLEMVVQYRDLGVRWMLPVYNHGNAIGGGCLDDDDGGLTPFGRRVVAEMNRAGVVVCGSHAGDRTARDLIDCSALPVIFSHSNPRSLWNSQRNIPDHVMIACAQRGGVVGLNGIGAFLGANDDRVETFASHVEYALQLIGDDHVGIALDYCMGMDDDLPEFMASYPTLFPSTHHYARDGLKMIPPWRLGDIAAALSVRGCSTLTLAKLFGGNHLRIAATVWHA